MSGERYPVLWIGQVSVVTLPAEIDVTNADATREELLAVLGQGARLARRAHTAVSAGQNRRRLECVKLRPFGLHDGSRLSGAAGGDHHVGNEPRR